MLTMKNETKVSEVGENTAVAEWVEDFFKAAINDMSIETTELFLNFYELEKNDVGHKSSLWALDANDETLPVGLRIMLKHCKAQDLNISNPAIAFLALSDLIYTPGQVSMYCFAIKEKFGSTLINVEVLGEECFPQGFPSRTALDDLWDSFKLLMKKEKPFSTPVSKDKTMGFLVERDT